MEEKVEDHLTTVVKECLINTPLLLNLSHNSLIPKTVDSLLSYDIGMEIECLRQDHYNIDDFKRIKGIKEVRSYNGEERFRIPSGVKSIHCLYEISESLKKNCVPTDSGIHYHVDMTDCFHLLNNNIVNENSKWILKELDSWNYKGTFNSRKVLINSRCWVRFHSTYKTMEVRIGEMTFEYSLMMERIIHLNEIMKRLKNILISYNIEKPKVNIKPEEKIIESSEEIISNRIIKRF